MNRIMAIGFQEGFSQFEDLPSEERLAGDARSPHESRQPTSPALAIENDSKHST